ncbi:putative GTP pyrophosphokinase [Gammaproteobacteria bacterium]
MSKKLALIPEEFHRQQIDAFVKERPSYETYERVLKRVLEAACGVNFHSALVQTRAKTVSSFAEKVARKFDEKHTDPINQFNDLCGARVIVQTTDQVRGVREFIKANFFVVEEEDKQTLLGTDRVGYRDVHYIVRLRQESKNEGRDFLDIEPNERTIIGERRAEIQVRTWVQHAWADTVHDRLYKTSIEPSSEVKRTANLLSALLEESDNGLRRLATELDGIIANYTAYASKDKVESEMGIQRLILDNEPDTDKKPGLALRLANLLAATGDHAAIVALLEPYKETQGAIRPRLLLQLGHSLCVMNRDTPSAARYTQGRVYLEEALALCESHEVRFAPNPRTRDSLHAQVLARLGWALEAVPHKANQAREYYRQAFEQEPNNPYYLANLLGLEIFCDRNDVATSIRPALQAGIDTCISHATAGIERPYSYFTAARLCLLLQNVPAPRGARGNYAYITLQGLGYYARGIRHMLDGTHCVPSDALNEEIEWLHRLDEGRNVSPAHQQSIDLLSRADEIRCGRKPASPPRASLQGPILIIAGGAVSMSSDMLDSLRPILRTALVDFHGTVIAGGTAVGIPGAVGDLAQELKGRHFRLVGYRPERLPDDAPPHHSYDVLISLADHFSSEQILCNWADILAAGIKPQDVQLLGLGGGSLSALEYRIALGFGASVGIVAKTGGAADEVLADPLWARLPNLFPLPIDASTVRAFVVPANNAYDPTVQEDMAKSFHARYVADSSSQLPANMRPWPDLDSTYKTANLEQAKYSVQILEACGFVVKPAVDPQNPVILKFTDEEVERMAELEHGRWNIERLRAGFRYGREKNEVNKLHPCIVSWQDLTDGSDGVKRYDRDSVRVFPEILAKAGLEVFRKGQSVVKNTS